jgi:protocatechuate 3,4-dioxygenase beta subunit
LAGVSASGAPPATLTNTTIRAGVRLALGESASGLVSGHVATLAKGAVPTFFTGKLKAIVALVLVTSIAASGLLAHQVFEAGTATSGVAEKPPLAPPKASAASPPATPEQTLVVRGRVLGPEGKPMNGAKVYVSTYTDKDKADPKVRAQTKADGRFRFTINRTEVDLQEMVAAIAPGYGLDWVSLKEAEGGGELTLRLVQDDVAIRGRVLDLEGRPIAGGIVRLVRVRKMPEGDLAAWLKELQANPNGRDALGQITGRYERIMTSVWGILGAPRSVTTGADGRFALGGFGANRVVDLDIEGPGIESRNAIAVTRPGLKGLPPDMHGPSFDHLAAPSKPIRGTVREKGTGKPLAGVRVSCSPSKRTGEVFTNKEGRFEFAGIGKSERYWLTVKHPEADYIVAIKSFQDTLNLEPIAVDLELGRAFPVRIRVTDKETGKPVPAVIHYAVSPGNPNLENYPLFLSSILKSEQTDKDGCCNLIALPGRGFLAIRAKEDRFTAARGVGQEEKSLFLMRYYWYPPSVDLFHAIAPIDPSAEDAKSRVRDIVLTPGRSVSGTVVGPDGRGLAGARVAGLGSLYPQDKELALSDSRFTVCGLEPGKPRTVVFWHDQTGLARAVVIRKDDKTPLAVRLESRGTAIGRLVDAAGQPRQGIEVLPQLGGKQAAPLPSSLTFLLDNDLRNALLPTPVFTDATGRFQIEGLVPGMSYDLDFRRSGNGFWRKVKDVVCQPGATVNVGEIKME